MIFASDQICCHLPYLLAAANGDNQLNINSNKSLNTTRMSTFTMVYPYYEYYRSSIFYLLPFVFCPTELNFRLPEVFINSYSSMLKRSVRLLCRYQERHREGKATVSLGEFHEKLLRTTEYDTSRYYYYCSSSTRSTSEIRSHVVYPTNHCNMTVHFSKNIKELYSLLVVVEKYTERE